MKRVLMAIVMLSLAPGAFAADAVLKVTKGHVSVRPAATKKWIVATPGLELQKNDQVMTGKNGAVQLSFANGATMLVKEKSRFAMRADKYGKVVTFRTGEFLIGLRKKLEGVDRFRVRTPVAVAAVRGTVFWGKHDETDGTQFACFTGIVDVWANGKNVELTPGFKTAARGEGQPSDPVAANIPPEYIQVFAVDGSLQGIDEQIAAESQ